MRRLIYVPIVHTQADMGSLAPSLRREYETRYGHQKFQEHAKAIEGMWEGIRAKLANLHLDYAHVRVYQDGLPVCGKERQIVQEVAAAGSLNHRLLLDLIKQGARLEGTEDQHLLLKEYQNLKRVMEIKDEASRAEAVKRYAAQGKQLLKSRDRCIARRIDETLRPGETGLLFIGITHEVDRALPRDIKVSYLIARLPFRKATEGT